MPKFFLALFMIILAAAGIAPLAAADVPCQETSPLVWVAADPSDAPTAPAVHGDEVEDRPLEPVVCPGKYPIPCLFAIRRIAWTNAAAPRAAGPPDLPPPRFFSTV